MDDACRVKGLQAQRQLDAQSCDLLPAEMAAVKDQRLQSGALDVLHDDNCSIVQMPEVVDRYDVGALNA